MTEPLSSRFALRRKLGEGGMGVVYEAYDRERGMVVALKTLPSVSATGIYRLKKEFRALSALRHPNLVTLYDLVHIGGRWLFTMELVEGVDLFEHVRGAPAARAETASASLGFFDDEPVLRGEVPAPEFDEGRLRAAASQLARCLAAIHDAGRVHRDLKPSNVLVRPSGDVVVLDFGLVHRVDRDAHASLESAIVGTPAYMAPEQASGEAIGAAADWYALGVILYQIMTGVLPFGGSMLQLLTSKQTAEPPHPSALAPGLPADLADLCRDLLHCVPGERPSGDEVLRRLGGPDAAPPSSLGARHRPPARLVGRARETAALLEAFEARGRGPVCVELSGAPGAGRTALLVEVIRQLEGSGVVVFAGRCHEREAVPYKAFDALVDGLARHLRKVGAGALAPAASTLARIFPVLGRVPEVAAPPAEPEAPDAHASRRRAFAALRALFGAIAEREGLCLVIDDAHWGDADSAAMLRELLAPPALPLVVVLSYRAGEHESPFLRRVARRAFRDGLAARWSHLALAPLAPHDAEALAAELLASPASAPQVAAEAQGNPLLIVELARAASSEAPTLARHYARRLAAASAPARALVTALALAATPLPLALAARAARLPVGGERAALELHAARLARSSWHRGAAALEIYSDDVRASLAASLDDERLAAAHGQLAAALEEAGAPAEVVAHHLERAGDRARATALALSAADAAMRALAFHRAAHLLGRALAAARPDEPARPRLLERLGDALAAAGRGAAAARAYLEAAGGEEHGGLVRSAFDLRRIAAEHLLRAGHIDEGVAAMGEVLKAVDLELPRSPRRALWELSLARARLRLRGLVPAAPREVDARTRRAMDACWSLAVGLGMADPIVGAVFQARHLLHALESGDRARVAQALAIEAGHVGSSGGRRLERAGDLLERAGSLGLELGDARAVAMSKLMGGAAALFRARWREAIALSDEASELYRDRCIDVAWELATARRFTHAALFYLGEARALSARVPEAVAEARARGDRFAESCAGSGSSVVAWLARGDAAGGRAHLEADERRWGSARFALQHLLALQGLTLVDLFDGRPDAGLARLTAAWPRMHRSLILRVQLLRCTMLSLRAAATVAAAAGPRYLGPAEADAARLEKEDLPSARALAAAIRAAIAARTAPDEAPERYRHAAGQLDAAEMHLHAAACRLRLGLLIGGDEGAALERQALAAARTQAIEDPERFFATLC